MLDESKVILMTRMSAFMQKEGREDRAATEYFRGDYVGMQVVKSAISATICFLVVFAVYVMCQFEEVMQRLYTMDLVAEANRYLKIYVICVGAYCVLTYLVYSIRYAKMRGDMKKYYANLKKLQRMNDRED